MLLGQLYNMEPGLQDTVPLQEQGQMLQGGPGVLMFLSTWKCPDGQQQGAGDKNECISACLQGWQGVCTTMAALFMELRDKTWLR